MACIVPFCRQLCDRPLQQYEHESIAWTFAPCEESDVGNDVGNGVGNDVGNDDGARIIIIFCHDEDAAPLFRCDGGCRPSMVTAWSSKDVFNCGFDVLPLPIMLGLGRCLGMTSCHLRTVKLDSCHVGRRGCYLLAAGFKGTVRGKPEPKQTSLVSIEMQDNDIDDIGCYFLAQFLSCCTSIENLDLSWNDFGCVGAEYIARAVSECPIRRLLIDGNKMVCAPTSVVRVPSTAAIEHILHHTGNTLQELSIFGCFSREAEFQTLCRIVAANPSLQKVRIARQPWGNPPVVQFNSLRLPTQPLPDTVISASFAATAVSPHRLQQYQNHLWTWLNQREFDRSCWVSAARLGLIMQQTQCTVSNRWKFLLSVHNTMSQQVS